MCAKNIPEQSYNAQYRTGGEVRCETMSNVIVKENETLDSALRRFKRNCAKAGIQQEIRKREHYEKPSVRRKKKSEAARKRKYNSDVQKTECLLTLRFISAGSYLPADIASGRIAECKARISSWV